MGGIRWVTLCAVLCAAIPAGGCTTPGDDLDLAENRSLYRSPRYVAKVAVDRPAFVLPVVDDRAAVTLEEASGPYPVQWMADGFWERPLPEMIGDCLRTAFADSGVFASFEDTPPPSPGALIVEPHLMIARAGREERVFGRRSLANVSVRIVVHGPADADGSRPVLLDEVFDQTVGTDVSPQPQRVPVTMGRALEQVVARVLARIDQSNVARSGLPIQAPLESAEGR